MQRRSLAKIGLRNKMFDLFIESATNNRERITLDDLFHIFRSVPAIIDKNRIQSFRVLKDAAYEACGDLRKCGILVLVEYSEIHHHPVEAYKVFDSESDRDIRILKIMQRRRVNRVQATSHITMDQIEIAIDMGMSLERYKGSHIIEKAKVIEIPESIGNSQ